jgi:site-specific DNA-methyltransferase (adenine-specific)
MKAKVKYSGQSESALRIQEAAQAVSSVLAALPEADNAPGAVDHMLRANGILRNLPWPPPFDSTTHRLHVGDARDLSWQPDESVHLVVTSPPYWNLKEYEHCADQMGDIGHYEQFLLELDRVWAECARVLVPGGRICCVVVDVCIPRKRGGRHYVMPLHADIQVRSRKLGLDCLTPILWNKIANGVTEAQGNGAGFYGKPYQPGAIIKNDVEYILFLRKGGHYRSPSTLQRALSMLSKDEMQGWMRSAWSDIRGESTRRGHPAPFPVALAERLIKMFSFAGDTVLDPFSGTGSTALGALEAGRNSVSNEIEPKYHRMAEQRLAETAWLPRSAGAVNAAVIVE